MAFGDGSSGQGGNFMSALKRLNGQIADMKLLPDADLNFLSAVEHMILAKARQVVQGASQQGAGGNTPGPGMSGPPGMGAAPPGGMPVQVMDQARGLRNEPQMPPPDQMRAFIQNLQGGAQ